VWLSCNRNRQMAWGSRRKNGTRPAPESIDCPRGQYNDRGPTCCSGGQTTNPKMCQAVARRAVAVAVAAVAESMGWSDCSNGARPACWGSRDSSRADLTSYQEGAWVKTKRRNCKASGAGSWIQRNNCRPWSAAVEDGDTRGCTGAC